MQLFNPEPVLGQALRAGRWRNAGQRKGLVEAVVQAVTVEGPARARLRLDLPIRQVGSFDRIGSNWRLDWWPQRDENPNGIPAEFLIKV